MTETWSEPRLAAGRRAWRLTLVGTMVSSLGTGLTLPFLFVFLHGVRHLPLPLAGTIVAVGAIAVFALSPLSGIVGDRVGLGRVMVAGLLTNAVGVALLAVPAGVIGAFVAVALAAAGNSLAFPALNGMVARQLPPEARSHAYALRFGVLNAGIGLGGLISGSVVSLDRPVTFEVVYLLDAATTVSFALIGLLGMRRGPGFAAAAASDDGRPAATRRGYRAVLANRSFVGFLVISFLFALFGYAQLDGPWAAFATLVVGVGPQTVGFGFAANTATIVVCQLAVSRFTNRWRRSRLLLGAGVIWMAAWAVTALADLPVLPAATASILLVVSLAVFGLGETLFSPIAGGLPNELAPDDLRGRYNALSSSTWSAAGFVGPPIAGILLGSSTPALWAVVVTVGMLVTAIGAIVLGRFLPSAVDSPTLR